MAEGWGESRQPPPPPAAAALPALAAAGRRLLLALYALALERGYRFYSFGDAMLLL